MLLKYHCLVGPLERTESRLLRAHIADTQALVCTVATENGDVFECWPVGTCFFVGLAPNVKANVASIHSGQSCDRDGIEYQL